MVSVTANTSASEADGIRPQFNIAVQQQTLPHYRAAFFRALDASTRIDTTFFACGHDFDGIVHLSEGAVRRQCIAPFRKWRGLYWQYNIVPLAWSKDFDALIMMGNPHYLSTWVTAAIARLNRKPVLFWTHGWLKQEGLIKGLVRRLFYRLANRLLLYSERGKALGVAMGYPKKRMTVIYNSLDLSHADSVIAAIEADRAGPRPQELFEKPDRPIVICTARLTPLCQLDLLLHASARLRDNGLPVNLLLVGDGPSRGKLEALAKELDLDIHFAGAVFDEDVIGPLIYHADLTVSPGKIGLTAVHSLMYGTPAITHSSLDAQMPEVETIIEGETGALFRREDVNDLTRVMKSWLQMEADRSAQRQACRAIIRDKWNPINQARLLEAAVLELLVGTI